MNNKLSLDRINELFSYDTTNGKLIRKKTLCSNAIKGDVVGTDNGDGYLLVSIDYTRYKIHRIVFYIHHGYMPEKIDHINGDKADNRIENLRECTNSENLCNTGMYCTNTSGYKGVTFHKGTKKWAAQIQHESRRKHIGLFDDPKSAHDAYCREARKLHGSFFNSGASK